jgi:TRAP-type C4-dicarboxylate transport system substrate-binding protein
MKKRTLTSLSIALALAALAAGSTALLPPPAGAQAKVVVWNFPHISAPTYYHTVNYNAFAAKVKEKSQGRMEIRFHPASSLYPGPELIPALLDGRAEIGPILASYLTDVLLELGPLELPFMTGSVEEHK